MYAHQIPSTVAWAWVQPVHWKNQKERLATLSTSHRGQDGKESSSRKGKADMSRLPSHATTFTQQHSAPTFTQQHSATTFMQQHSATTFSFCSCSPAWFPRILEESNSMKKKEDGDEG
jgi:hypothetical protein